MAERDLDERCCADGRRPDEPPRFLAASGLPAAPARSWRPAAERRRRASARAVRAAAPPRPPRRRRRPRRVPADIEKELFMYNWATTSRPTTSTRSRREFGVENVHLRHLRQQRGAASPSSRAARPATTSRPDRRVRAGHGRGGLHPEARPLARSRTPQYINATFKGLWWDPTDEYQVPKDYGTTGILYRKSLVSKVPQSWQRVLRDDQGRGVGQDRLRRLDGRRVRLPAQDARLLAQHGGRERARGGAHRSCWRSRRTSWPSTRTSTATRWRRRGRPDAGLDRAARPGAGRRARPARPATSSRPRARCSGSTPG